MVTQGIIVRPPPTRLADYEGEFSYLGTTLRQANIEPMPSLSDVRRLITEFGILPLGQWLMLSVEGELEDWLTGWLTDLLVGWLTDWHKSTIMLSLNAIAWKYLRYCYYSTSKTFVQFEMQWWPWRKVKVIRLRKHYIDLWSDYFHSKLDGHCLNSFWNNRTFIIFMINLRSCVILNEGQGQYD